MHREPLASRGQPGTLGQNLERFLRHLGAPPVQALTSLHDRWPEVVGPVLAKGSRPIELVDGILIVGCADPSWASQLAWMETQIKQRCAALFDGLVVVRISVRVDR
ncbi:MAG: DUF721 domain-containing protein [Actinomycetota bacterium]|nr:DUF721 domain-containing protein [Actinomycetota bacterium]